MGWERREVTWFSPAIGARFRPLGLEGLGELAWNEAGILMTGPVRSQIAAMAVGAVGVAVGFSLGLGIGVLLPSAQVAAVTMIGGAIGGAIAGVRISTRLIKPKTTSFSVAWARVANLELAGGMPYFVSMDDPTGSVYFALGKHDLRPSGHVADQLLPEHRALVELLERTDKASRTVKDTAGRAVGR